jgi:hypothetical protein
MWRYVVARKIAVSIKQAMTARKTVKLSERDAVVHLEKIDGSPRTYYNLWGTWICYLEHDSERLVWNEYDYTYKHSRTTQSRIRDLKFLFR